MARIVFGTYLARYPLGGMMSNVLEYLVALRRLGHEVFVVERAPYPDACFDPVRQISSDDCRYGFGVASSALEEIGLASQFGFVDYANQYHGLSKACVEAVFRTADVFIDYGAHGSWNDLAAGADVSLLIEGEPGFTQIRMETGAAAHQASDYDFCFTNGLNIGTAASQAPTLGLSWHHLFHPVNLDRFEVQPPPARGAFTTIMNWQSHGEVTWRGAAYGQKDYEFTKFIPLPSMVASPLEAAVSGTCVPHDELASGGWRVRDAQAVTLSLQSYRDYISGSLGEFAVCKNVFVALNTGWFSDRSAAYLASGRPVVLQDTGWSQHLPTGAGLFAYRTLPEAAEAIEQIEADWLKHSRCAREIAREHLEGTRIMASVLSTVGL